MKQISQDEPETPFTLLRIPDRVHRHQLHLSNHIRRISRLHPHGSRKSRMHQLPSPLAGDSQHRIGRPHALPSAAATLVSALTRLVQNWRCVHFHSGVTVCLHLCSYLS